MNKSRKLSIVIFLACISLLVGWIYYSKKNIVRVDIVYTNDLHGHIEVIPKISYYAKKLKKKQKFNIT